MKETSANNKRKKEIKQKLKKKAKLNESMKFIYFQYITLWTKGSQRSWMLGSLLLLLPPLYRAKNLDGPQTIELVDF